MLKLENHDPAVVGTEFPGGGMAPLACSHSPLDPHAADSAPGCRVTTALALKAGSVTN